MLVLTRKEDEQIIIDNNIVLTIVRIAGGHVRLGIDAPESVRVARSELTARPNDAVGCDTETSPDIKHEL